MLLVLGDVARDRLVTELGELDPQLVRGDPVHAVADDRPRAPRQRVALRGHRDRGAAGEHLPHRVGQLAQARRATRCDASRSASPSAPSSAAMPSASRYAGRELRVERLRRRDAHLHVATVGRVEHAVALVDEVALAPVDDRDHGRAARAGEVDRAVRVGGGARLRDRDHDRVAHVVGEPEARELGRGERFDRDRARRRAPRAARARGSCPATCALPWPITSTRRIAPAWSRRRESAASASRPGAGRRGGRRAR